MELLQAWVRDLTGERPLGPGAARVVEVLGTQPQLASYASTAELAERAGVNVATVVRASQLLGFTGWPALRLELRNRYLSSLSAGQVLTEHARGVTSPATDAIRRDVANLEALARSVDPGQVTALAAAIAAARRTVAVGSGSFAAPLLQLSHLAQTMGHDVRLSVPAGTAMVNDLRGLQGCDLLVVCNLWWTPRQVLEAARLAHERSVVVAVITDRRAGPFAEVADVLLVVPSEGISLFPSLAAAMTVVHGVLAELARTDDAATREAVDEAEALWQRLDLFCPP